jgi:hypothetical protein
MNHPLAQLAQQAGITVTAESAEFAELIVAECADIAHDTQYNHGRASYETGSCARAIRQHFEVQE